MTPAFRARAALRAAAILATLAACQTAGVAPAPRSAVDDTAQINRDITYLASDALEGRGTGTPGNDSAAAYIARRYASLKLTPPVPHTPLASCSGAFVPGFDCAPLYMQRFYARSVGAVHAGLGDSLRTQNVAAIIPGSDPALRGQYVVIGAHFDHLGRSSFNAQDPEAGNAIRHGADDNASGTAAVMELARLFAKRPLRRTLLLVDFSGEELGVLGSQYFVDHSPVPVDSMLVMINLDMVGRLRDDKLIVQGVGTATELKPLMDSLNAAVGHFTLALMPDGYGPSDQASFYSVGVPVLFYFTDVHEDYHKATDVASKINILGEARVIDFAAAAARELGNRPSRLSFVKQAPPKPMGTGGKGAWFGSVPDMAAVDVVGVRLTGVSPGSPAEKAGLQKGDVIVEFGGDPIKNLYDYSAALQKRAPGDTVQVVVVRDGKQITLTATLGKRGG